MTLSTSEISRAFSQFKDKPDAIVPDDKLPSQAYQPMGAAMANTAVGGTMQITGRLNYTEVGVCPYCAKVMSKSKACDQEVYICHEDRFVSPLPNEE